MSEAHKPRGEVLSHEESERDFPPLSEERMAELDRDFERRHETPAHQKSRARAEAKALQAQYEEDQARRAHRRGFPRRVARGANRADQNLGRAASQVSSWRPSSPAGLIVGALVYAVGINYLRGGWSQVRNWGSAKFLNKVAGGAGTTEASSTDNVKPKTRVVVPGSSEQQLGSVTTSSGSA